VQDTLQIKSGASIDVANDTVANRIDTDKEFLTVTDTILAGGVDSVDFITHESGFLLALTK